MEQKVTTPVVKGLVISLILIVFSLALYFAGQTTNKALGSINYVILLVGIIWGCINYANQMNHNVTFGNVFAHGFKITAVITVITIVYTIIAVKFIMPEIQDLTIEEARANMEKNNASEDQIDTAINMTRKFFIPFLIGGILFIYMIVGLICSLIGAAVAKKNPKATPFQQ